MSQRRTSLSFPLGIVSLLLIFDCSAETRDWENDEVTGGAGGNAHAGNTGLLSGASGVGAATTVASSGSPSGGAGVGATSSTAAGGTTVEPAGGGAQSGGASGATQAELGGTGGLPLGGAGGVLNGSGGELAGTAGLAGAAGAAGSPPQSCGGPTDCDDGNACNGVETCVGGTCSPGSLPAACAGMDAANCRCAVISGGGCGIVGLDADGDGIKTRSCAADPGLDCNDGDATVTHNACNGCATLPGAPGGSCGSCGASKWICSGPETAACSTPTPAPKQCSGINVQSCTAGAWVTETACSGTTPVCIVNVGVPQCGACDTVGVKRCKPGATNVVQTCSSNRLSWTDTTCGGLNLCYYFAAGDYRCALCQPGATRCKTGVTNVVQTCNAAGTAWADTTCGASSLCVYSSSASMYTCAQLLPGDLQNEIEFERTQPAEQFNYQGSDRLGVQPFLDFASGFALV